MFSHNVDASIRLEIANLFAISEVQNQGFYLGLPTIVGRNKAEVFKYVKDKVWNRLHTWHSKLFSQGKEILLKSVALSIPNYVMNVFLLPFSLCDEIEKMLNSFWWAVIMVLERV